MKMPAGPFPILSLYTGAGGLDLGFEAAGYSTRAAVELDQDAAKTLGANRDWNVLHKSIHEVKSSELLTAAELTEGDAAVLVGGPPCQPFSKSGYWARGDARRLQDPRATTLEAYLRVLRDAKPQAFLLENVPGLAYRNKEEGLQLLRQTIQSINGEHGTAYSFSVGRIKATDFGVPQYRERVFIIGHRDGIQFTFPAVTHGPGLEPYLTAWDAIGEHEDDDDPALRMGGKWAELLPTIPEGANYLHHTDRGGGLPLFGWRTRYWNFLLKLAKQQPSWTLTADPGSAVGPFHWKNRRLSATEMMRLQTFPAGYSIIGNQRSIQRQLGNAVPSALAELLALEMRRQFFGDDDAPRALTLLPARVETPAVPEPVAPVPARYALMAGEHEPHPGTGLGPAAIQRKRAQMELSV